MSGASRRPSPPSGANISFGDLNGERRPIDLRLISGELGIVVPIEIVDESRPHDVVAGTERWRPHQDPLFASPDRRLMRSLHVGLRERERVDGLLVLL